MPEVRNVLVPDGLAGERLDTAVARLFGVSRSKAADLAAEGKILLDGAAATKSERVHPGSHVEISLPSPGETPGLEVVAEPVPGMRVIHDDDDIVVVDKPGGAGRRCSGVSRRRATGSARAGRASVRASSLASTSAPPG